ncbi:hypothetical protein [Nesterenkonia sp.]|uniref:hypothetical protein n=1 Tax=Nesterenkonia sp. TaxID=704201 RepID=UPI0026195E05|nr:hypothetical protein [Nesterenkonia sp.]
MASNRQYTVTLPVEQAEALESRVRAGMYSDISDAISKSLDRELGAEGQPEGLPAALQEDIKGRIAELDRLPEDHPSRNRTLEDLHQAMQHTRAASRRVA